MADCVRCERPMTADTAYACSTCAGHLATDLTAAAELLGELQTAVTRQVATGSSSGRGSGEVRLPFDVEASYVSDTVNNTFTTWARLVAEERGMTIANESPSRRRVLPGPLCGERTHFGRCEHPVCRDAAPARITRHEPTAVALRFLLGQVEWFRQQPHAAESFDELGYAAQVLRSAIDRRADRVYLGRCWERREDGECAEDLYAVAGRVTVACQACETVWDVAERRRWLLGVVGDVLAPAVDIARALTAHSGKRVAEGTVYSWASRHRLEQKGTSRDGRPLYRLGDALALADAYQKRQRKGSPVAALLDVRTFVCKDAPQYSLGVHPRPCFGGAGSVHRKSRQLR